MKALHIIIAVAVVLYIVAQGFNVYWQFKRDAALDRLDRVREELLECRKAGRCR